jgi:predicted nucleic acid-binding protein
VKTVILDPSVAAKWFLPDARETLVDEARQTFADTRNGKTRIAVPDLFWVEMGGLLSKAVRVNRTRAPEARRALSTLGGVPSSTFPTKPLLASAFAIATKFQRTVYDGIYLALAISSGSPPIAADEKLVIALAAELPVEWVGAYEETARSGGSISTTWDIICPFR